LRARAILPKTKGVFMRQPVYAAPPWLTAIRVIQSLLRYKYLDEGIANADRNYRDTPGVQLTLAALKTALDSDEPLAQYGVMQALFELFRSASLVGRLFDRFIRVPFRTKIPLEIEGASVGWVPETGLKPVTKIDLDTTALDEFKVGGLIVITNELIRTSNPAAEAAIRTLLVAALSAFVDTEFLSSDAPIVGTSPGGILYGQQSVSSTGSSESQIRTDLGSMIDKQETFRYPIWICKPKTFGKLCSFSSLVQFVNGVAMMYGFPLHWTTASPARIELIDIGSCFLGDDAKSSIETSLQSTITMDDGASPASLTTVSLFERNLAALKIERFLSWKMPADHNAVGMSVAY
jgi:hypothetical protein